MAVGDRVIFTLPFLFAPEPPLKGTVEADAPAEEILFDNGQRQIVDSRGDIGDGSPGIETIADPTQADLDTWLNRFVEVTSVLPNVAQHASGVVVDVFILNPGPDQLLSGVLRTQDGLFVRVILDPAVLRILPSR